MFKLLFLLFLIPFNISNPDPDQLCGKWMSAEKTLEVQVYRDGVVYKAKIVWFRNNDNSKAMDEWTDKHNPDPAMRDRKLIGMSVLRDLVYMPKSNSWEGGKIYDAEHGHEWDASAYIDKNGNLKVTGYWHFKFIGRTIIFSRVI